MMAPSAHKPTASQPKPLFNRRQMTDIYNAIADKPLKTTFKTQEEAVNSILKAIKRVKESPVAATPRPGRKPEYSDDDIIATVAADNPKKPGSAAHERFALYKKGMKVAEYIAAGGNRADLAWDIEHKYITIRRA